MVDLERLRRAMSNAAQLSGDDQLALLLAQAQLVQEPDRSGPVLLEGPLGARLADALEPVEQCGREAV